MSTSVRWIGRATTPWAAVPCSACNASIGEPCKWQDHPHLSRTDLAEALGFREIAAPGGLFEERAP